MKHLFIKLIIICIGLIFYSCDTKTPPKYSGEKIKQDSIFKADSINSVFTRKIKESNNKEEFKIKRVVKMILADNQNTYILKGDLPITDTYIQIYSSDERKGDAIIIYWNKEMNSSMEFIVTQTINNITDSGYETTYICKYIVDLRHTYSITKIMNKDYTNFSFMFDFDEERNAYMQHFILIPYEEKK